MSTTGVITSVTPVFGGGTLAADVATGDTVLPLDDAADFAEDFSEPRYLVIGADLAPLEYVAVANDEDAQESVTLAAALPAGVSFEADLPVVPWDPEAAAADKRAVEFKATVRLDGQDGSIAATVPHQTVPLAGADTLVGVAVRLAELDAGEWRVEAPLGREPLLDGGIIDPATMESPSLEMTLAADSANIPDSTYTRVTWPSPFDWHSPFFARPVMVAGPFLGTVEVVKPGRYIVIGTPVFVANSSGIRRARLVVVDPDGTTNHGIRIQTVDPPTGAVAAFQVIRSLYLEPGQCIGMEVMQTSGAGLALAGTDAGSLTALEVVWVATV